VWSLKLHSAVLALLGIAALPHVLEGLGSFRSSGLHQKVHLQSTLLLLASADSFEMLDQLQQISCRFTT
jgi:hypothetical protein